jgi:ubiquinone/menaquinone biosynthesis C-methylase UbiE
MDESKLLASIIESSQNDPASFSLIKRNANGILTCLGMDFNETDKWLMENIKNKKIRDLEKWETELHDSLNSFGIYKNLEKRMKERAGEWFSKIQPHLLKTKTLDLGGGSGEVAKLMQDFGCKTTIADVINWVKVDIPFIRVKNNRVDAKDGEYDQVVLLTVFHHTDDVTSLVKEAFRVAGKRVIFIESVTESTNGYIYGAWIDWFYNHIIHFSKNTKSKINVPCNFLPATGWEQMIWKHTGLKPKVSINLGIFQFLNPENHHLFVYEK